MAAKTRKKAAPWKKGNPATKHKTLSSSQKRAARASARKAGRPYPNLVDNMKQARKRKAK